MYTELHRHSAGGAGGVLQWDGPRLLPSVIRMHGVGRVVATVRWGEGQIELGENIRLYHCLTFFNCSPFVRISICNKPPVKSVHLT